MSEERFLELAAKYLSKEASNEERASFYNYLEKDEYYSLFTHLKNEWEKAGSTPTEEEFNFESGLEKLTQKIKMTESAFSFDEKTYRSEKNIFFKPALLKYAASIAFLMILSTTLLYYFGVFNKKQTEIKWNENLTKLGQKFSLTLSDGSSILLNGGGKLLYPQQFGQASRDIYLEGEAYFNVAHDTSKPFIVHTGNVSTTVLGTKFNVSAFSDDRNISISLVEGKVKVSKETNGYIEGIVELKPKQQLNYSKEKEIGKVEDFILQETIGWKDNILIFKKELFSNVIKKLERAYGVKFELADKSFGGKKITANFQNESLWTISETLKKLTGLQYKSIKENNETKKIVFYKK